MPEVDPDRISAAGHSSASVPALDLEKRFGPEIVAQLKRRSSFVFVSHVKPDGDTLGAGLALGLALKAMGKRVGYFHKRNEDKLQVPLFLFHAKDDSNVPVVDTEAFAADLKSRGKPVTLDLVEAGDHYDSMINEGIPRAIAWLNEQGAGPGK